jgi:mRNA-degrading endonuclease toxin of MazEF toxin-antitoxin module
VKRGEIWTASRAGHDHKVIIVGHDALTASRDRVLVIPISDARSATLIEPAVADDGGQPVGVALTAGIREMTRAYLTSRAGALAPASSASLNVALRAALDL